MTLKDEIIKIRPRETVGSLTSSKYDFQKNWAICLLLEKHLAGKDYLIILDYHDDVVVLDSLLAPNLASFYQIKTKKDGAWKIGDLTKRKQGKKGLLPSILGNLYCHKINFGALAQDLNIVSNASYNFQLAGSKNSFGKVQISAFDLSPRGKKAIKGKLRLEHQLPNDPDIENCLFFLVTELSHDDHTAHTKGKLIDFLEKLKPDFRKWDASFYKTLFDEIRKRNNYVCKDSITFEELAKLKGISRVEFQQMLTTIALKKDYQEEWRIIENRLDSSVPFETVRVLRNSWRELETERMRPNNDLLDKISQEIRQIINSQRNTNLLNNMSLLQCTKSIYSEYRSNPVPQSIHAEDFLNVVIIEMLNE